MFLRHLCRTSAHLLQALLHDGHRCAISGVYDNQSYLDFKKIHTTCQALDNPRVVKTEVVYIFSQSAQEGDKVSTLLL